MPEDGGPRRTARGLRTRERIVESAVRLFYVRGVHATTLDDVRTASGTSKSQLYHHFADKIELVREVIDVQSRTVLERDGQLLHGVRSLAGLRRWRDARVQAIALQDGSYGCAIAGLCTELADTDEPSRQALAATFDAWTRLLVDTLDRLRAAGVLRPEADPERLGVGLLAALQGGYLLARGAHDPAPMGIALDMALAHIDSFAG
jgi:TetR/AcrR family transcriptional regulator, transcriptional repressor for nem operon